MSHDCALIVSLSGIAKCLFCVETLAFLAESRPLGQFTLYILTSCKTLFLQLLLLYGYNVFYSTLAMSPSQNFNSVSISSQYNP